MTAGEIRTIWIAKLDRPVEDNLSTNIRADDPSV
jgi:hypothetical protein